ncbi:hypothetical protein [Paenibacillus sp. HB172176]|uniref:hypothetical protein n=1 Tax=Paenibacillus sp. HB172176 TaxID=2493690 RepID=UPI0014386E34|nr:hypothetical protein [Paenibacillus sp. HB172176]
MKEDWKLVHSVMVSIPILMLLLAALYIRHYDIRSLGLMHALNSTGAPIIQMDVESPYIRADDHFNTFLKYRTQRDRHASNNQNSSYRDNGKEVYHV